VIVSATRRASFAAPDTGARIGASALALTRRAAARMAEKSDHAMTEAEAAVLDAATADATAAAGAAGGALGGAIGGRIGAGPAGAVGGAAGGRKGGASGGRFGARFLKPMTVETTVEVPCAPDTARECARALIAGSGRVIEDPNESDDGSVWGIVASGAMDLVPALVRVQAEAVGPATSRVHIRATGKEGLIKQGIAAKAADRIAEAISVRSAASSNPDGSSPR
jgi:hypothetical protein